MARLNVQIQTSLAIRDAAAIFQQAMRRNFYSEFLGHGFVFSKPPTDEAFGDLDDDPPTFSVMATLGSDLQVRKVILFAWDRGDHRDLLINEGGDLLSTGILTRMKVNKFVAKLREMDSSVKVVGI